MANKGGKPKDTPGAKPKPEGAAPTGEDEAGEGPLTGISELARRALGLGFTGFFLTEEAIRKALGDSLPRDWVDFAVDQSDRTRADFVERLATELAGVLQSVDLPALAERLVEGRTIEVNARIRVGPREPDTGESDDDGFELSVVRGSRRR